MAARKQALGKGLDSLIPPETSIITTTEEKKEGKEKGTTMVKVSRVEPNRSQPRSSFDEEALQELAESIRQFGLLQPILVQDKEDHYEIIAGERRWRAAKLAGLKEIPVIIKNYSDQEIVEISLIENIQREDLNPIEEAQAYRRLLNEFQLKQEEVAERVSKSRTAVTNSLRLLKLDDQVQQMLIEELISPGHGRALLSVEDQETQRQLAQKICEEKLSVRETEEMVKKINGSDSSKKAKSKKDNPKNLELSAIYEGIGERLKSRLSTKVTVTPKGSKGSGKIEIEFYSNEDLERLMELIEH